MSRGDTAAPGSTAGSTMQPQTPDAPERSGATYYPALDGLRAFAVLAVIAFHSARAQVPGGFLGVDVFYVISGFVITLTLMREHERTGRIAMMQFYRRRFWRLMPALVAAIVLAGVLTPWTRDTFPSFLLQALQAATYTLNIGHTFSSHPGDQVLSHTWSLGIEEQFYVMWAPTAALLLTLVVPRGRRALAVLMLIVVFLLSGLLTAALGGYQAALFLPWARFPELLVGAALAVLLHRNAAGRLGRILQSPVLALAAAAVLAVLMLTLHDLIGSELVHGGFVAVAMVTAVLVGHTYTARSGPVWRLLDLRPSVWLGQRSYGLYLYHWPITVMLHHQRLPRYLHPPIVLGAALLLAAASYAYLEQPLRRRGHTAAPQDKGPAPAAS
jgi:peptidoglycan/LPS O-acetylase OafA/YrhL